jgi:hypothetical protein
VKSVRLSAVLEDKLRRAAGAAHLSESDFIREAISERCDRVLGTSLYEQIKPFIGVASRIREVDTRRSDDILEELIGEEHDRQVAEWERRRSS